MQNLPGSRILTALSCNAPRIGAALTEVWPERLRVARGWLRTPASEERGSTAFHISQLVFFSLLLGLRPAREDVFGIEGK